MMSLDQQTRWAPPALVDEGPARRTLRDQITRLDDELAAALVEARRTAPGQPDPRVDAGPRLLDLGELERVRDALAARLGEVRGELDRRAAQHRQNRALLERALLDPAHHPGLRLSTSDLGLDQECRWWIVRPRLGLLGRLLGWWRVKISSGCP